MMLTHFRWELMLTRTQLLYCLPPPPVHDGRCINHTNGTTVHITSHLHASLWMDHHDTAMLVIAEAVIAEASILGLK